MNDTVILLPTYNESENIATLIREIFSSVPGVSVLVIDDNSPDGTGAIVHDLMAEYPALRLLTRQKKEGLGEAYKAGIRIVLEHPNVQKVVTMDADGSHAPEYLPTLLTSGADLVIGSRYVRGGSIQNWEFWRRALSYGGNLYARTMTGLPVKDLTSGFMCFKAAGLRRIDLDAIHASGYAFLMEMKFQMHHVLAGRIEELPIVFKNRRGGESKISNHIIREGFRTPLSLLFQRGLFH